MFNSPVEVSMEIERLLKLKAERWPESACSLLEMYRAQSPVAEGVPEGFKLVPVEPTQQMLDAGAQSTYGHPRDKAREWAKEDKFDCHVNSAQEVWRAMLAAFSGQGAQ